MSIIENKNKFYLYDRWFEYQNRVEDKYIYISTPKLKSSYAIIEIDKKTKEILLSFFENNKIIEKIEISDISKKDISVHYIQEECNLIEMNNHIYNNISLELFGLIKNDSFDRNYQIKFVKQDKKSKNTWIEPPIPLNEIINIQELDFDSKIVDNFIDLLSSLPMFIKKINSSVLSNDIQIVRNESPLLKELTIPQSLEVYDRVYNFKSQDDKKIVFSNEEDGIRNLEIRYNSDTLSLLSVSLKIKESNNEKAVIQISKNNQNGITAKYGSRSKSKVRLSGQTIEAIKIKSVISFDDKNQKTESMISLSLQDSKMELLEHPNIKNNYTDGAGNLYVVNNSGYHVFYGIANYATGIFNSIEKKMFKEKVLK